MRKLISALDVILLSLMIVSLPSFEAPKNIFLVGYLVTRLIIEIIKFHKVTKSWERWDSVFVTIVFTALLSTLFSGFQNLDEWRGYKVLLTAILIGWFLSRSDYTKKQYLLFFQLAVLGIFPPLLWGLYEYLIIHSKINLQIHSVGHVNHSAIYLTMIFGASLSWFISYLNSTKRGVIFDWSAIFLGILTLLLFISLIIGQSRGAFGISVILTTAIICLLIKKKNLKILAVGFFTSILILSMSLTPNILKKHMANQANHNVLAFRDRVWNVSFEAARLNPILGIGISNWSYLSQDQIKKIVERRAEIFNPDKYSFQGHSHSLYLTALVERGIIGLIVTFIFMMAWIYQLKKTFHWAKKTNETTYLWGGSFSAWIATFGIGLVNTTFHHEHGILACIFLGLYLGYSRCFFKK